VLVAAGQSGDRAHGRHRDNVTVFRKSNRPALGPVGDSLDDLK